MANEDESEVAAEISRETLARSGQLSIFGFNIRELPTSIAGMDWLRMLFISCTRVRDLSPLSGLAAIETLSCTVMPASDLTPLSGLTGLAKLDVSETLVHDLSPLSALPALAVLNCSETQVRDLSPLSGLTKLANLFCSQTPVSDLSPLSALPSLTLLECSLTEVRDLAPVIRHSRLNLLAAYGLRYSSVPAENLSTSLGENCLPRVRSWWANQQQGSEPFRHHKLFLLGNGTVGKTQVARRLRGMDFDDTIASTHGIQLHDCPLPAPPDSRHADAGDTFNARIWDFGGQDIYHGTHALFLKTRAIFLICWEAESEAAREHETGGQSFRNYPLAYWLDYVRNLAGANAQVILVQTQTDKPGAPLQPPVDLRDYADLTIIDTCRTSAKEARGIASLKEAITTAVGNLERPAMPLIGTSERSVLDMVTALRDKGERTLTMARFEHLCAEAGLAGEPEHLLHFLHHSGELFHADGLFGDQIIIDQRWALDAIYAVFDRAQCWQAIQAERGRFTRKMLGETVWQDYTDSEREHFLAMMLKCGMAFKYIEEEQAEHETVYIAPDLLPNRDEASVTRWVRRYWADAAPIQRRSLAFPLLHDGLMRAVMRGIGEDAGLHAVYWKNGLLFFDSGTGALAIIEAHWPEDGWAGEIVITTQRRGAAELAERLEEHVRDVAERIGLASAAGPASPQGTDTEEHGFRTTKRDRAKAAPRHDADGEEKTPQVTPAKAMPLVPTCYVSYAWSDGSAQAEANKQLVDDLCADAAARGIDIRRDTTHLADGGSITAFTEEIARADRVVAMIGGRYWKRPDCFMELYSSWIDCKQQPAVFRTKVREYIFADAGLYDDTLVGDVATHWENEFRRCDTMPGQHRGRHHHLIAEHADSWAAQCRKIIPTLQDKARKYVGSFEDYKQQLFAELESMRYRGPNG